MPGRRLCLALVVVAACGGTDDAATDAPPDAGDAATDAPPDAGDAAVQYTVTVALTGNGAGTVTSTPAGIDCGTACSQAYPDGTWITLHPAATTGSTFAGWSGGACSGTGDCVFPVGADLTVQAAFTLDGTVAVILAGTGTGTVTSSPAGIDCPGDCSEAYGSGQTVTLTATPGTSSTFSGWSGGGCSGTGTCTVSTDAPVTVTAIFTLDQDTLTVSKQGAGSGTVTSSPAGIDCGGTCSASYAAGTTVTLTATAATGSVFVEWTGGCSGTGACTVTINGATTVTATFTLRTYWLIVTRDGTGTGTVTSSPGGIDCSTLCTGTFFYGQAVTVTASPSAMSTFAGWSGSGCSGTGACTVTINGATAVNATFNLDQFTLTVGKSGTGTGTVTSSPAGIDCGATCSATYADNTTVTLTATAAGGSSFTGWSGSCSGTGACTVTMTAARTVTAAFNVGMVGNAWPDSITRFCSDGQSAVTCPAGVVGQDGYYTINVPTYTATTDTVTDTVTGLMWQRDPPYTYSSFSAANTYCADLVLAGFSDWRLPDLRELVSLLDAGRIVPPWPTTAFPGIPGNSLFWSADRSPAGGAHYAVNTNYAVVIIMGDAGTEEFPRCVRGAAFQGTLSAAGGSVTDSRTGLVWQSGTASQLTWQDAIAYCEGLVLDGNSTWRLPSVKELYSVVETSLSPAIATVFSSRPSAAFWSSTAVPNVPYTAYAIDFATGASSGINTQMTTALQVRCVHD